MRESHESILSGLTIQLKQGEQNKIFCGHFPFLLLHVPSTQCEGYKSPMLSANSFTNYDGPESPMLHTKFH